MDPALYIIIGVIIGAIAGVLVTRAGQKHLRNELERQQAMLKDRDQNADDLKQQQERYTTLDREHAVTEERLKQVQEQQHSRQDEFDACKQERDALHEKLLLKSNAFTALQTRLEEELKNNVEKQQFFKASMEQLEKQFKATASELLINTSENITKQQSEKLTDLMKPFRENLTRFEKEFKTAYDKETRDQISLKEQIKHLGEMNSKLSSEAQALANALKGDSKIRGNWGEQMLVHILQSSGLRSDHEYSTQESFTGEDGNRLQPDVIINLPDDKSIIIDSKVTLNAWMDYVNADTEEARSRYMKSFTASMQMHVKTLSEKNYHKMYGIQTLDFILMFIPIETAFLYALQEDPQLYDTAHKKNIILVSPTTLMAVLKTIAVNWKHDRQEKNTLQIAKEAEHLLDKIHNYAEDLVKARNSLQTTEKHFDRAYRRFATGKGNIKESTEKLRQLGVKSAKKMGIEWDNIDEADEHEFDSPEEADTE